MKSYARADIATILESHVRSKKQTEREQKKTAAPAPAAKPETASEPKKEEPKPEEKPKNARTQKKAEEAPAVEAKV